MKKGIYLLLLSLALGACATLTQSNMDWIDIGPTFPKKNPEQVEIITSVKEITHPYGNIGLLRITNLEPDRDTLRRGVQQGRKFVASKGADAMFLGQYNSAEDGDSHPKVTLIIYALKYGDNLTEADLKALEDYEVDGALNGSTDL